MTDITDWDELAEEVRKRCQELFDKVWGELNRMADVLNDAASHFDWVGVLFPIPKLIWDGLTSDDVERAIDKFNNEIRPQLEQKARDVVADINKVVGTLAGDPPGLKKLSFDYAQCREQLVYPAPSIQSEVQQLGKYWKGEAFAAYSLAAGEQVKAMTDAALGMERAADMTNKGAAKILQLWVDLNDKLIGRPRRRRQAALRRHHGRQDPQLRDPRGRERDRRPHRVRAEHREDPRGLLDRCRLRGPARLDQAQQRRHRAAAQHLAGDPPG